MTLWSIVIRIESKIRRKRKISSSISKTFHCHYNFDVMKRTVMKRREEEREKEIWCDVSINATLQTIFHCRFNLSQSEQGENNMEEESASKRERKISLDITNRFSLSLYVIFWNKKKEIRRKGNLINKFDTTIHFSSSLQFITTETRRKYYRRRISEKSGMKRKRKISLDIVNRSSLSLQFSVIEKKKQEEEKGIWLINSTPPSISHRRYNFFTTETRKK